jgi:hypothetical protein
MRPLPLLVLAAGFSLMRTAHADWKDMLKDAAKNPEVIKSVTGGGDSASGANVSGSEAGAGLKEALAQGASSAVRALGRSDGFWGNEAVRIAMPDSLKTVEKGLRAVGKGRLADEFVQTLNRAAEAAVPETLAIIEEGIRSMSFDDALRILRGSGTEATEYLKRSGGERMQQRMLPIVKQATARTGVTRKYKEMQGGGGLTGALLSSKSFDIDRYVTTKASDGLFYMIGQEEQRIRTNPAARGTELLQKVFAR